MNWYPLSFEPIFKERIWGGTKLKSELGKPILGDLIGESWEISTVQDNVSCISNGIYQGIQLDELIKKFPTELLGNQVFKRFGFEFPLLFKFLDAKQDLSIQVHPNDEIAQSKHQSFGKTEMWYVLQADQKSELIIGFKQKSSAKEYLQNLENKNLLSILDSRKVAKGDVFFLETGTVHAIGAGTLIAEIQQTSDVTYRIYDFERKDIHGIERELHLDLALDAINFDVVDAKINYHKTINQSNEVIHCNYFKTNFIALDGRMNIENKYDSFLVYMCVDGFFNVQFENQNYDCKKGDTILIPAALSKFIFSGIASVLEIYV